MQKLNLKNNVSLLFDANSVKDRFALCVAFHPGGFAESTQKAGVFHLMEHMLFKSDEFYDQFTKVKLMEYNGIDIGASTSYGAVKLTCSGPNEKIEDGLRLIYSMWKGATYQQEDFEKEKQVVLEELRMYQNNPSDYVDEWIMTKHLFAGTPLAISLLGTKETLNNITQDDLRAVKSKTNVIVSISAQISDEQKQSIQQICQKTFCLLEKQENDNKFPVYQPQYGTYTEQRSGIDQSYVQRGYIVPSAQSDQHTMMLLLSYIIDGGMSSRAFQLLREENALGYAVGARYDENYGYLVFFVHGCDIQQVELCIKSFNRILQELSTISNEEFEGMKTLLRSHLLERITCQETIASDNVDEIIYKHKNSNKVLYEMLNSIQKSDLESLVKTLQEAKYVDAILNPEQES